MTLAPQENPRAWEQYAGAGTEDIDSSDIRLPRLKIDGVDVSFVNTQSKEEFNGEVGLHVVVLGMVKQRTWFPKNFTQGGENKPPICKSNDFSIGWPSDPDGKDREVAFPWAGSGLVQQDIQTDETNGRVFVPCDSCKFQKWGKNREAPPCKEVHTYALLYQHPVTGDLVPAVLSVKSSAIKNSREFVAPFHAQGRPLFTFWTRITLTANRNGSVRYAVPNFMPLLDNVTAQDQWSGWFEQYKTIRDMLRAAPRSYELEEDENGGVQNNTSGAQGYDTNYQDNSWQNAAPSTPAPPQAPPMQRQPAPQNVVIQGEVVPQQQPAPQQPMPAQPAPQSQPQTARVAPPAPPQPPAMPPAPPQARPAPQAPSTVTHGRVAPPSAPAPQPVQPPTSAQPMPPRQQAPTPQAPAPQAVTPSGDMNDPLPF